MADPQMTERSQLDTARAVLSAAAAKDGRAVLTVATSARTLQRRGVPTDAPEALARSVLAALEREGVLREVRKPAAQSGVEIGIESWPRGRERRGWVHVAAAEALRAEMAARRTRAVVSAADRDIASRDADLRSQAERVLLQRHRAEVEEEIIRLRANSGR